MSDILQTKSIYLAAALISLGAEITQVDKADPRHMEFFLEKKPLPKFNSEILEVAVESGKVSIPVVPTLKDYEAQWANDTLAVIAPRYAAAIQRMKSIIHST